MLNAEQQSSENQPRRYNPWYDLGAMVVTAAHKLRETYGSLPLELAGIAASCLVLRYYAPEAMGSLMGTEVLTPSEYTLIPPDGAVHYDGPMRFTDSIAQ